MFFRTPNLSPTPRRRTPVQSGAFAVFVFACFTATTAFVSSGCSTTGATAAARNASGVELYASGDYDRAIEAFQESLEESPDSAETLYNLGSAYQRKATATGDFNLLTQAENAYWAALERDAAPETIVCCYRGIATSATTRGDVDGALRSLEDWRDRNPDSIEPKLEIAYFLEAQERDDDAYAILQEVAEAAPNDYRAFYKMGILQERAGNFEEALNQTTIAGRLNPTDEAVARRATELRSQVASVQRGGTLADGAELPGETTLVSPTSAESTEETGPNSANPANPTNPTGASAPKSDITAPTDTLDANEVVLFSSPTTNGAPATLANRFVGAGSATDATSDDNSVRWISATSAESPAAFPAPRGSRTSGLPDGSGSPSGAIRVAQNVDDAPVRNAAETQKTASTNAETPAAATFANDETSTNAEPTRAVVATSTRSDAATRRVKTRTELNSGPPGIRAGSFF